MSAEDLQNKYTYKYRDNTQLLQGLLWLAEKTIQQSTKELATPWKNISSPVSKDSTESTIDEVNSMEHSATSNRMTLNLLKTWKMLIYSKTTKPDPPPVPGIERKSWLRLLGITF